MNRDWFFLILIGCVFVFGGSTFFKAEDSFSELENRSLSTFRHFTIDGFGSGDFQNSFESAISDQFFGSEYIKYSYRQAISNLPTFGLEKSICKEKYLRLKSEDDKERGIFDCSDYIVYLPVELTDEQKGIIENNVRKYNKVSSMIDTFYYFIDDASSFDFEKDSRVFDYYAYLSDRLNGQKGLERLEYNNFVEYMNYFYKTDHHWNKEGSYQGFKDIAGMLGVGEPVKPNGVVTNHEDSFGSNARMTSNFSFPEEFEFYKYNIPEHTTLINGVPGNYNHYRDYEDHNYKYGETVGYYAYVYGDDYGEVIFDFNQPEKENILIISNSYSNAVSELIAQYYNKTFKVDLRHYREQLGEEFVLSRYVKKNKIDKVLMIMSPSFLWSDNPNRGLES